MNVGICKVRIHIPGNSSLKDKRQVVKSITARLQNRFNVSVAEVDDNDLWQVATLGVCMVSNNQRYCNEVLSKVLNQISDSNFQVEIIDHEMEFITV